MLLQVLLPSVLVGIAYWLLKRRTPIASREGGGVPYILTSLRDKFRYLLYARFILKDAYWKYDQGTVQYTTLFGAKKVLVATDELINELQLFPNDDVSFAAWTQDVFQLDTTLPYYSEGSSELTHWPMFAQQVSMRFFRGPLTKELPRWIPMIRDDIRAVFTPERMRSADHRSAFGMSRDAMIGPIMRFMVGEPLCKDPEFLAQIHKCTGLIPIAGAVAGLFPTKFSKLMAVRWLTGWEPARDYVFKRCREETDKYLGRGENEPEPLIYDFLHIGLVALQNSKREWTLERLYTEVITNAFAGFHTTVGSIATMFIALAVHHTHQAELRQEIRSAIAEKGWTIEALESLELLESFMLEARRFYPLSDGVMNRKVLRPVTLRDGTRVERGGIICGNWAPRLMDERYYENPEMFDPARFTRNGTIRFSEAEDSKRNMSFGAGKHRCPGRFFATAMLKVALSVVLMEYEIYRLPNQEGKELVMGVEENRIPSPWYKVGFRELPE